MPKGITRFENYKNNADGWWVRLRRQGETLSKFFKDSDYPSKAAALKAAREHYRQLVKENPKTSRREFAERKTARSSEIVGVQRVVSIRFGHEYEHWKARWSPKKGVRRVKTFSVDFYGEEEAKRLAIEARQKGLEEMQDK
jgi:hypothetical protein